jgi:hypothetical protein
MHFHRHIALSSALLFALTALAGCSAAAHYRSRKDRESLLKVLREEVSPGDSLEEVQSLLGPGAVLSNPEDHRQTLRELADRSPERYPDGIEESDEFLVYPTRVGWVEVLQFRNGRLINFNPRQYEEAPSVYVIPPI